MSLSLALAGILSVVMAASSADQAPPQVMDPTGSYEVSTADEEGFPLSGTLVIRAGESGEYVGQFTGAGDGEVVPVLQATSNGRHLMAILETGAGLAVAWLQRQEDGTLTGTWHLLGDAIRVKAVKKTGEATDGGRLD